MFSWDISRRSVTCKLSLQASIFTQARFSIPPCLYKRGPRNRFLHEHCLFFECVLQEWEGVCLCFPSCLRCSVLFILLSPTFLHSSLNVQAHESLHSPPCTWWTLSDPFCSKRISRLFWFQFVASVSHNTFGQPPHLSTQLLIFARARAMMLSPGPGGEKRRGVWVRSERYAFLNLFSCPRLRNNGPRWWEEACQVRKIPVRPCWPCRVPRARAPWHYNYEPFQPWRPGALCPGRDGINRKWPIRRWTACIMA